MKPSTWILPIIVISQFCCTSLWFASNGVMEDLLSHFSLEPIVLGHLTSFVQLGFIIGTLLFALLTLADRFPPSRVFFFSAIAGALTNLAVIWEGNGYASLLVLRFLTGFFLAGIYPVGMKIAADYYEKGLGKSLGLLVGALVLGTAFPHLLKGAGLTLPWISVLITTSIMAAVGGTLMWLLVPNGPHRKSSQQVDPSVFFKVFKNKSFRAAAFGYFGHMWELYAFWAFVPVILSTYQSHFPASQINIPFYSFLIIGIGGLSCVLSGFISLKSGPLKPAFTSLLLSGLCCLISPAIFFIDSTPIVIGFLLFWGMVVIADSPLFSTLVAQNTVPESKGTALTIVNSIGFAITIFSIQLLNVLSSYTDPVFMYMALALGPAFGLMALSNGKTSSS